ncbi:anthrone oxygenase family protein [Nonomuraea insulae]|uniref:Anthrone oxygenase family protein n=1 Tax=Nonomuraea insulae TaxID=1616787 RepID=A0ABW1D1S2_9ACTN
MRNDSLAGYIRFLSLTFAGLFAGFVTGVLIFELSLRDYDGSVYTQVRQIELDRLDTLASVTLIPALITTAILVALAAKGRGRAFWLTSAALVLLVTVFVTTLIVNLPINGDQAGWSVTAPPPNWADIRDRWQIAHAARTVAAVLAFALLVAAAIVNAKQSLPHLVDRSPTDRSAPAPAYEGGRG